MVQQIQQQAGRRFQIDYGKVVDLNLSGVLDWSPEGVKATLSSQYDLDSNDDPLKAMIRSWAKNNVEGNEWAIADISEKVVAAADPEGRGIGGQSGGSDLVVRLLVSPRY